MKRPNRLYRGAWIPLMLLLSAACVMPEQVSQMQKDLADVRRELGEVRRSQDESAQRLAELEAREGGEDEGVTRADLADFRVGMEQISRQLDVSQERMGDIDRRLGRLAEETRQLRELSRRGAFAPQVEPTGAQTTEDPGAQGGARGPGGAATLPDPEALYNTAYADFSKGNFALAISGFEEFQEKFPDSAQADNALYWVAECHFSQGNFAEAIAGIDHMLERYPESDKAPAGNLKKALAFLEQNQIGQAIVQFRYVMSKFEGSDEAKIARDKLTSLGAPI